MFTSARVEQNGAIEIIKTTREIGVYRSHSDVAATHEWDI